MNTQSALIQAYAKQLRLPTVIHYEEVLRLAQDQGWGYEQFLGELLLKEINQRQENQLKRRVRQARFPLHKSLDEFRFNNLPNVQEATIWQLATGEFVQKRENIIMIGNPGTGKTHFGHRIGKKVV